MGALILRHNWATKPSGIWVPNPVFDAAEILAVQERCGRYLRGSVSGKKYDLVGNVILENGAVVNKSLLNTDEIILGNVFKSSFTFLVVAARFTDVAATSGPLKVAEILTSNSFELNIGNGFGALADIHKPRATGVHNMWIDGIKQPSTNPAQQICITGKYYNFLITVSGAAITDSWRMMGSAGSVYGLQGGVKLAAWWDGIIPDALSASLSRNPWQLLRPMQRRLWVAGGGGQPGTPYTLYQDMYARISWDQATAQDALAKVSTLKGSVQDATASVSLVYSIAQDAFTAISEDYLVLHDAQATISEQVGYSVTQDALAQIHETYAKVQDASAGVSSEIIVVQDARAAISEGVVHSVTHDAIAQISSAVLVRQDAISKVASTVREIQDAVAGVSSGYLLIQDGKAVLIEVDFDTMAKLVLPSQGVLHMSLPSAGELRIALTSRNIVTIVRIGG